MDDIVDIFNGNQVCHVYENNNLLFVGNIKDFDFTNYTMLSIDFKDGCVVVEVEQKGEQTCLTTKNLNAKICLMNSKTYRL